MRLHENSWQYEYKSAFNAKIDHFRGFHFYNDLRKMADEALALYTGPALDTIIATDFINRLIVRSFEEIEQWQNGESELNWSQDEIDYGTKKLANEAVSRFTETHDKT